MIHRLTLDEVWTTVVQIPKPDIRRAMHVQVILGRNPSPYFPLHVPLKLDIHQDNPSMPILIQRLLRIWRNWHVVARQRRWPHHRFLVPLVRRRQEISHCYLLVSICGVDVERLVLYAYPRIRVSRGQCDLHDDGDGVGRYLGDVELINGDVFEVEAWLGGVENEEHNKH